MTTHYWLRFAFGCAIGTAIVAAVVVGLIWVASSVLPAKTPDVAMMEAQADAAVADLMEAVRANFDPCCSILEHLLVELKMLVDTGELTGPAVERAKE